MSKRKQPRPKAVDLLVRAHGSGKTVANAEGLLTPSPDGATFRGFDQQGEPAVASFHGWSQATAGRPKRRARDEMTTVLRNYLAVHEYNETSRERAEELDGRPPRTLARHRAAAIPFVRMGFVLEMTDGRQLAVALMHDRRDRGRETRGPAWVLWSDGESAEFVADFDMKASQ